MNSETSCATVESDQAALSPDESLHSRWWMWPPAREQHFRAIADEVPGLAVLMTPAGSIEYANRQALEFFGSTLAELKGWMPVARVHPDDLAEVERHWQGATQTGRPCAFEARLARADGEYRWFNTRAFPLRDTQDQVIYWYLLQTDVDDLKRAQALLAGEKRLLEMVASGLPLQSVLLALCELVEEIADGSSCTIILLDDACTYLHQVISPSMPATFTDAIQGRPLSRDAGPCAMAACLNSQVVCVDVLKETRWQDLGWPAVALSHGLRACWSTPITAIDGKVLGTFALQYGLPGEPLPIHQNLILQFTHLASIAISRAKREDALKRSEAMLAQAQHMSSTGSISWRIANEELTLSEQYYRIFEFEPGVPVTTELVLSRVHPDDAPMVFEMINRAREDRGNLEYECRLLMPDQSIKYLQLAHGTINQGDDLEYIGAVQDITKRKTSEQALDKVRSELAHVSRVMSLGALTASIAHEVNQPLSGIVTNAGTCMRMLTGDPPNVEGALETARRTIRDANRAADVIARLRGLFSRKEAAKEMVDLNAAARDVINLIWSELQRGKIILKTEFSADLPAVLADRVQLQQVILNLLSNAKDAMVVVNDRARRLVVSTDHDQEGFVRLSVRDVGTGFGSQEAGALFDPFYTTKATGMGIGLSVSKSIIESHDGILSAKQNAGPGATFSFSIPRGKPVPAASAESAARRQVTQEPAT